MTAFEVEMARAARFIEAQDRDVCPMLRLNLRQGSANASLDFGWLDAEGGGSRDFVYGEGARPEDALCELLDRVEGRS